jgi:hypothetical protein
MKLRSHFLGAALCLMFTAAAVAQIGNGTVTNPFLLTGTQCAPISTDVSGVVTFSVQNTASGSSWSGTIQPSVSLLGDSAVNVLVAPVGSTTGQPAITASGTFYALTWGASLFRLCGNSITNTVQIKVLPGNAAVAAGIPLVGFQSTVLDPCQSPLIAKSSAFLNITSATTTALVAVSGSTNVYVCSVFISNVSTTTPNTLLFEQGTGTACVGTPTAITSTINFAVANGNNVAWGATAGTIFHTTAGGNGICAVSTVGSTPQINLTISYVQM